MPPFQSVFALAIAVAQTVPPASAPPSVDSSVATVMVQAPSPKRVHEAIEAFSEPHSGGRLARWREPICPLVAGFSPEQNRFIAERMVEMAHEAGIPDPRKSCDANVFVFASKQDLADRRAIGRHAEAKLSDQRWPVDRTQLEAFTADDHAPVHVFYVLGEAPDASGGPAVGTGLVSSASADAQLALQSVGFNSAPAMRADASRLTPSTDEAFVRVVIVLDGTQTRGVTASALAAYLTVVSLSEVKVGKPLEGVATITSLFADLKGGRPPPETFTFWDRAYLGALYSSETQANLAMQRSEIADKIKHSINILKTPTTP